MSCYNPMLASKTGVVNPVTGKSQYKFLRSVKNEYERLQDVDLDHRIDFDTTIRGDGEFFTFSSKFSPDAAFVGYYHDTIGNKRFSHKLYRAPLTILACGQCLGCRVSYAAEWADRILMEAQYHDESYFLTLTYDKDHVPRHQSEHGDEVLSLEPRDLQLFIKRLRRQQDYDHGNHIRFYSVGEYGSMYHRPHYHLIVFGLKLFDLKEIGKNKQGHMLHDSQTIRDLWGNGITTVEVLDWQMAAYCARYTVKKLGKVETGFYEKQNLVPEFSRMSLKPAIGAAYFDEHHERIYKSDQISIPTGDGVRHVKPPRYFDKLYDDVYPADMERVKGNRKQIAKEQIKLRLANYSGSYLELLAAQEAAFKSKTKSLRRTLE